MNCTLKRYGTQTQPQIRPERIEMTRHVMCFYHDIVILLVLAKLCSVLRLNVAYKYPKESWVFSVERNVCVQLIALRDPEGSCAFPSTDAKAKKKTLFIQSRVSRYIMHNPVDMTLHHQILNLCPGVAMLFVIAANLIEKDNRSRLIETRNPSRLMRGQTTPSGLPQCVAPS